MPETLPRHPPLGELRPAQTAAQSIVASFPEHHPLLCSTLPSRRRRPRARPDPRDEASCPGSLVGESPIDSYSCRACSAASRQPPIFGRKASAAGHRVLVVMANVQHTNRRALPTSLLATCAVSVTEPVCGPTQPPDLPLGCRPGRPQRWLAAVRRVVMAPCHVKLQPPPRSSCCRSQRR